jgi:flavin reductase (DIM6/NTAB) family NADH-FMN oxidoreductase RutF
VSETPEAFHTLVSGIDYPMFIVTAAADGRRSGCLVGFVTQASIDPARLIVMISKVNHTFGVAERASSLIVHILHKNNHELARLFGEQTGDEVDKFVNCEWKMGPDGTPVLLGVRGWVAGEILARLDAGDHVAHVISVTDGAVDQAGSQLGFQAIRGLHPGHPA